MKNKVAFLLFFFAMVASAPVFSEYNSLGIPDSAEIRSGLYERWFNAPLRIVRDNKPEYYYNNAAHEFKVFLEEDEETFQIFVSPHTTLPVKVYDDKGFHEEIQDFYGVDVPGSFVVVRDKKTDKTLRIRYYFLKDSDIYVQFTPNNKTALADFVMFGNYAARGVATGIPFDYFYLTSIEQVIFLTKEKLPWNYVLTNPVLYSGVRQMAAEIQGKLSEIKLTEDAMIDEHGKTVHITTGKLFEKDSDSEDKLLLSSAGFVKWIADGLVEPISGGLLKRSPLIKETVSVKEVGHQGILSQSYDLYFSLDWIRNLATAVISVYSGTTYMFDQSGVDVTINPFASTITDSGIENIVTFIGNSGYSGKVMKSLLYVLAATEPDTFYFGAIRGTNRNVSPEVKAFNECVAFFPYFLSDGVFACSVFMNGKEFTLDEFIQFYGDDFIYLTRVKASEQFFPQ